MIEKQEKQATSIEVHPQFIESLVGGRPVL